MTMKVKEAPPAAIAMIPADSLTPAHEMFLTIDLENIRFSSTNPRKNFDPVKMAELVESVRSHGVLQPILVRPIATEKYEIVAGERRYRAAKEAGLSQIPATVRTLTDKEVLEIQFIENLLRDDLHPLEEAEGYQLLIKEHGYTVADLALKVGKSEGYVRARMKLAALPKNARHAFLNGAISPSVALLIARIPNAELAEKAAKEILKPNSWAKEPMTHRQAAEHIQENYMLRIDEAGFDTANPDLLPSAGACTSCPKRTGNQPELFPDIKKGDLCTDPSCFNQKKDIAWKRVCEEAKEKGQKTIDDAQGRLLYNNGDVMYGVPYIKLSSACDVDPKRRSWQKLLGKHAPTPVLVRDQNGRIQKLIPKEAANKALTEAGHNFKIGRHGFVKSAADVAREKAEREKALIETTTVHTAVAQIVEKIEAADPNGLPFWRLLLKAVLAYTWHDHVKVIAHRRGVAKKKKRRKRFLKNQWWKERPEDLLLKHAEGLSIPQIKALIYELSVCRDAKGQFNERYGKRFKEACTLYNIDLEGIEQKIRSERKEAKTQKKPPQTREKKKK